VAGSAGEFNVVGGHDNGVTIGGERVQHGGQPGLGLVIQTSGGLVKQQHRRRRGQLDGQHERELLPGRQVPGMRAARHAGRNGIEDRASRPAGTVRRAATVAGIAGRQTTTRRGGRVVVRLAEFRVHRVEIKQVGGCLRDQADQMPCPGCGQRRGICPVDADGAGGPVPSPLQRPEQGGFSRAVATHQGRDLARPQRQAGRPDGYN
jgi:hypothetical protein